MVLNCDHMCICYTCPGWRRSAFLTSFPFPRCGVRQLVFHTNKSCRSLSKSVVEAEVPCLSATWVTESCLSFDFDVPFHSLGWPCSLVIHLDGPRDLENTQRGSILVISLSRETHLLSSSTTWLVFSLWQNPLCYKGPTNTNENC